MTMHFNRQLRWYPILTVPLSNVIWRAIDHHVKRLKWLSRCWIELFHRRWHISRNYYYFLSLVFFYVSFYFVTLFLCLGKEWKKKDGWLCVYAIFLRHRVSMSRDLITCHVILGRLALCLFVVFITLLSVFFSLTFPTGTFTLSFFQALSGFWHLNWCMIECFEYQVYAWVSVFSSAYRLQATRSTN